MFQRFIMTMKKNTQKLLKNFSIISFFVFCFVFSTNVKADFSRCKNKEFQETVKRVAKEEGVDSNELLSIIAHESRCNYFVIAWNLPGAPQTARNKFFESLEEAKTFAEELITTKKYRVDVGIGQINNEANIKREGWTLEEVLNPKTALNRVALILKERGWANYHSSNPFYANKWRRLALTALDRVLSDPEDKVFTTMRATKKNPIAQKKNFARKERSSAPLMVFNVEDLTKTEKIKTAPLVIYRSL